MKYRTVRETRIPSMEKVTQYITLEQFLEPWRSQLQKMCAASGIESDEIEKGSRLYSTALKLFEMVFGHGEYTDQELEQAVADVDWLLQLLAPGEIGDERAAAFIHDSFWSTLAGRTIFQTLEACLGEDFCDLEQAARRLGISKARIYHWVSTKQVPSYLHEGDARGRRKIRVRLDQVKRVLEDGGS
jgi:hypothetical protein